MRPRASGSLVGSFEGLMAAPSRASVGVCVLRKRINIGNEERTGQIRPTLCRTGNLIIRQGQPATTYRNDRGSRSMYLAESGVAHTFPLPDHAARVPTVSVHNSPEVAPPTRPKPQQP